MTLGLDCSSSRVFYFDPPLLRCFSLLSRRKIINRADRRVFLLVVYRFRYLFERRFSESWFFFFFLFSKDTIFSTLSFRSFRFKLATLNKATLILVHDSIRQQFKSYFSVRTSKEEMVSYTVWEIDDPRDVIIGRKLSYCAFQLDVI